jgi:hypothetical protein
MAGNDGGKKKKKGMVTGAGVEVQIANGTPSSYVLATVNQNVKTASIGPMTHPVLSTLVPGTKKTFSLLTCMPRPIFNAFLSSVEAGPPLEQPQASDTAGNHPSKGWMEALQNQGRLDNDKIVKKDIIGFVRNDLFPKLKFIIRKQQLEYSPFENSICGKICAALGMKNAAPSVTCWERHKNMIVDVLNAKRADVTGAIKKEFLRKYKTQSVADIICPLTN